MTPARAAPRFRRGDFVAVHDARAARYAVGYVVDVAEGASPSRDSYTVFQFDAATSEPMGLYHVPDWGLKAYVGSCPMCAWLTRAREVTK